MLRAHPASSRDLTLHLFLHNHKKFARSLHSKPKQAIEGNDLVKISLEAFSRRASSLCGSTGCAVILLADGGMAGVRMWQLLRQQFVFAQDGNPPLNNIYLMLCKRTVCKVKQRQLCYQNFGRLIVGCYVTEPKKRPALQKVLLVSASNN